MSIQTQGFDWQRADPKLVSHTSCAPALIALRSAMAERWGLSNLGCYGPRAVRLGTSPSSHGYGAALDLGYADLGRDRAVAEVIPYLIAWSAEWGITAVHDYVACRIWHAGRTADASEACDAWWKAQRPDSAGMGKAWAQWFHVEVAPWRWSDRRVEAERGIT